METYFSVLFKSNRRKMGVDEGQFAKLLEIDVNILTLIEKNEIIPEAGVLLKLDLLLPS